MFHRRMKPRPNTTSRYLLYGSRRPQRDGTGPCCCGTEALAIREEEEQTHLVPGAVIETEVRRGNTIDGASGSTWPWSWQLGLLLRPIGVQGRWMPTLLGVMKRGGQWNRVCRVVCSRG